MADKKADASDKKAASKKSGLMPILSKVFGVLVVLSVAVLFAGLYDVGGAGMKETLMPFAAVLIGVYALFAIADVFIGGKSAPTDLDAESLMEKIEEVQKKNTSRLMGFQNKIDILMGQDYEELLEKNKELQAQIDAVKDAEREKVDSELEALRLRNEALEEQMKKWALDTVGSAISKEQPTAPPPAAAQRAA